MTMMKIFDLDQLHELLDPSRETRLARAMDDIETFFADHHPKVDCDASVLLDLIERLTADLSQVFDSTYASWFVEHDIDKQWTLRCQVSRINKLCNYYVWLVKYYYEKEKGEKVLMGKNYPISTWSEKLPETH